MNDLSSFQQTFGRALLARESIPGLEVALTIHRNTCFKGLVDALTANYPTVAQLVADEWFTACAQEYARQHPPRSPVLATYGESFPAYLETFPPAATLVYLPDVARIDRLWVEAHTSQDADPLTSTALGRIPQSALTRLRLPFHPATRIAWVSHSAAAIWMHHRTASPEETRTVDDAEEGILLTRPVGKVEALLLDRAAFEFLQQLKNGAPLTTAAEAVLARDCRADVAGILARTITAGTFRSPLETGS